MRWQRWRVIGQDSRDFKPSLPWMRERVSKYIYDFQICTRGPGLSPSKLFSCVYMMLLIHKMTQTDLHMLSQPFSHFFSPISVNGVSSHIGQKHFLVNPSLCSPLPPYVTAGFYFIMSLKFIPFIFLYLDFYHLCRQIYLLLMNHSYMNHSE